MARINIGKETELIEFKKSTGELKEAVISIASILNKHGNGELYFGVKNNGDVIGQDISESTLRDVSQAVSSHIKPTIYPEISLKTFGKLNVVYVKFEGNRAPYLAYNIPRIRVADEDKVMEQEIYEDMLQKRGDISKMWELQTSEYTLDDIVLADFKSYLIKAKAVGRIDFESEEPAVVMDKLELLAKDGFHLLNAGAVLFCNSSMNDVLMAKFATDVKATFTDIRREDRGSIIGLSKICTQYIIDAMDWKADIVGLKRVETPEIPVEAVREAIINSYGHRLYNNNQCNEIDVFKDRIEIHTTGGFPKGHTPEEFFDGKKKAIRRNKRITGVLYYSKDMETFATGLKRIKDLCDEAGCKLDFRTEKDDFVVVFYRNLREEWNKKGEVVSSSLSSDTPKLPRDYQDENEKTRVENEKTRAENEKTRVENEKTRVENEKTRVKILNLIKENPYITSGEMAEILLITKKGLEWQLKKLRDENIIRHVGSKKGGHWEIVE